MVYMDKIKQILAANGKTNYIITLPQDAIPSEVYAAEELSRFLGEISGVQFPIEGSRRGGGYELVLGPRPDLGIDNAALGDEGFIIKTLDTRVIIAGGRPRGTLYGVYVFLEKYFGCRWFTPQISRIPKRGLLSLEPVDYTYVPCFDFRNTDSLPSSDPVWAARNRMNGYSSRAGEREGGMSAVRPASHSFNTLVPFTEFGETHPEYFSEIDGKRKPFMPSQICFSNPDVQRIVIERISEQFRKNPDQPFAHLAQNDCLFNCQCEQCRALDGKYGAHSGSLIWFANLVAEAIEKEFPGKIIQTYAYQYGQIAPKGIKPRHNVNIWLCSIESCFAHPFGECGAVRRELPSPDGRHTFFAQDIKDWTALTNNVYVWDYIANFRNYVMPHPNLQVFKKNLQFFRMHGVRGVFEEACPVSKNVEFVELRAYMLAQLMWNPDADDTLLMEEFLEVYYGMAAPAVKSYIKLLANQMDTEHHLYMSSMPRAEYNMDECIRSSLARGVMAPGSITDERGLASFFTPEVLQKANELFDYAEQVADNSEILDRVRIARLPIRFMEFIVMAPGAPGRQELMDAFFQDVLRYGITELKSANKISQSYKAMTEGKFLY